MTQGKKVAPQMSDAGPKGEGTCDPTPMLPQDAALRQLERFQGRVTRRDASDYTALGYLKYLKIVPANTAALRGDGRRIVLVLDTGEFWPLGPYSILKSPVHYAAALGRYTKRREVVLEASDPFAWRAKIWRKLMQAVSEAK